MTPLTMLAEETAYGSDVLASCKWATVTVGTLPLEPQHAAHPTAAEEHGI